MNRREALQSLVGVLAASRAWAAQPSVTTSVLVDSRSVLYVGDSEAHRIRTVR